MLECFLYNLGLTKQQKPLQVLYNTTICGCTGMKSIMCRSIFVNADHGKLFNFLFTLAHPSLHTSFWKICRVSIPRRKARWLLYAWVGWALQRYWLALHYTLAFPNKIVIKLQRMGPRNSHVVLANALV